MSFSIPQRRFVIADLSWLIAEPTTQSSAGLTAYRQSHGPAELFSVYLKFWKDNQGSSAWDKAKIYALASEMEGRLPIAGGTLVIRSGATPVAEARVVSEGSEPI
jgi:hypothetical protein